MRRIRITRRRFLTGLLAGVGTVSAEAKWHEPQWLKTRHIQLPGTAKVGHRLVQFTDVHHKGDENYLKKVVEQINDLNPTTVCFTGDLVEEAEFAEPALKIISQIRAPLYGVPGNHDYWAHADFEMFAHYFAKTNGHWLMARSSLTADGKINLIGLTCTARESCETQAGCKNVALMHYPMWAQKVSGPFDLILAGHSHGGQVRIPGFGSLLTPSGVGKFEMGLYPTNAGPIYVNPGIGYFYLNVRFCCRPEISVFEL